MSTGFATFLLFVPIVAWAVVIQLWLVSICYRKKKPLHARIGLVGVVVPGLFVVPLVGASRLARPSSSWARLHYGDELLGRAARRYPDDHDVVLDFTLPKQGRRLWEKLIVGGLVVSALAVAMLYSRADYVGLASVLMLVDLTMLSWLAEVELTAKSYTGRVVPATAAGAHPLPEMR